MVGGSSCLLLYSLPHSQQRRRSSGAARRFRRSGHRHRRTPARARPRSRCRRAPSPRAGPTRRWRGGAGGARSGRGGAAARAERAARRRGILASWPQQWRDPTRRRRRRCCCGARRAAVLDECDLRATTMEAIHLAYVLAFLLSVVFLLHLRRRGPPPTKRPATTMAHCPHPQAEAGVARLLVPLAPPVH